jgi:hypothetical protein
VPAPRLHFVDLSGYGIRASFVPWHDAAEGAVATRRHGRAEASAAVTLRDLHAQGVAVLCWCNGCDRHARLATGPLIARLGPGCGLRALAQRLRCSRCGSKAVETRPAWPPIGQIARHTPLPFQQATGDGSRDGADGEADAVPDERGPFTGV